MITLKDILYLLPSFKLVTLTDIYGDNLTNYIEIKIRDLYAICKNDELMGSRVIRVDVVDRVFIIAIDV